MDYGFVITDAKREKAKARICLTGTSGSGKTLSALYLAYGLTGDWSKVGVIDSERGRALFYANRSDLNVGTFKHLSLDPPYSVDRYIGAMQAMEQAVGEDGVIIIDSGSHAWKGDGGVLDVKESVAQQRGKTDFSAWSEAGKIQNSFIDTIMGLSCHCIVTLRSKMDYIQDKDPETGKSSIKKVGLAPVQRDDFEYEFTVMLEIDRDTHIANIEKDNTFLEAEGFSGIITPELGERLKNWLSNGVEPTIYTCECCGEKIKTRTVSGKVMSPKQIAESSQKKFKKTLCLDCAVTESKKLKEQKIKE